MLRRRVAQFFVAVLQRCPALHLEAPERQAACVEATRMAGAFAKLTGSFQAGMQTLQRVRSGGRQTVVVQYNTVSEGGQAVIGAQQHVGGGGGRRKARGGQGA